MIKRILNFTGYSAILLLSAVYISYIVLVVYLNNGEFFFTPPAPTDGLTKVEILIKPKTVQKIDQRLWPQEDREYHKLEGLTINGKAYKKASIKVRGWERHHWAGELNTRRRSWRIRIQGGEKFKGSKTLNLRRMEFPTYTHGHVPYLVGKKLGLLIPETDIAAVYWNNSYYGLASLWEQLEPQFLKNHGLPKGLIFSNRSTQGIFDLWSTDTFLGNESRKWRTYPDTQPDSEWDILRRLYEVLEISDDTLFLRELRKIFEVDDFIRDIAFWNLGGSFRQDIHNIRIYHNPKSGKLQWILWDIAGFHYTGRGFGYSMGEEQDFKIDWCPNVLMYRLIKIPEMADMRNKILHQWIASEITRSDFKDIIRSESERILPFVASENNHLYPYRIFKQSQEKFLNWVDFRYDFIENELSALNVQFRFEKNALKLTVDGQSAFLPKIIVFDSTPGISKAVLDINQNGIEDESDIQVDFDITGNNLNVKTELRLLPGKKDIPKPYPSPGLHENSLEPAPKSYYLLFKSSGEQLSGRIRSVEGFNGITGEKIQASIAS